MTCDFCRMTTAANDIPKLIDDIERLRVDYAEACAVCERLAEWWRRHGIEGTRELDDIAFAARGVVFKVKGPEKP